MARGKTAIKVAEKPEDYKLAANEFTKALEYAPKCADIYYQLGLCYEQMGKLDPGNYQEAISCFNNYLAYKPTAANKNEIQEKIYEIEFLAEKAGGMSLKSLIGKWKFYYFDGDDDEPYDIEISENQGYFYVTYRAKLWKTKYYCLDGNHLKEGASIDDFANSKNDCWNSSKITYDNNVVYFSTDFMFRRGDLHKNNEWICKYTDMITTYYDFNYELTMGNEFLKGKRVITKKIVDTLKGCNSEWQKSSRCENNCGSTDIYFVKQ
jgi:tetratricopeptide (TPR) repeat protein